MLVENELAVACANALATSIQPRTPRPTPLPHLSQRFQ